MLTVYRASAGSGKTFTLAARYIALLLCGNRARSILAVTFTNKATAEMKTRILTMLYLLADNPDNPDIKNFRNTVERFVERDGLTSGEIQRLARRSLDDILSDYSHFSVTTIDAFLQSLLSEVARTAGLQTNYKIELSDDDVTEAAIDRMLKFVTEKERITRDRLMQFIDDRIAQEEKWDVRADLLRLAKQLRNDAYLKGKNAIADYLADDAQFSGYRTRLRTEGRAKCIQQMRTLCARYAAEFEGREWGVARADWMRSFAKRMMSSLDGTCDTKDLYRGLTEKGYAVVAESSAFVKPKAYSEVDREALRQLLLAMHQLCTDCRYHALSQKVCEQYLHELGLLTSIAQEVDEINREEGRMLLSMTPLLLKELIRSEPEMNFVLERAGTRYRHLMIDEFQDTAWKQWDNFRPLMDEIMANGGSTLIVGDVKQSIYRWRGGDWNILRLMGPVDQMDVADRDVADHVGAVRYFGEGRGEVKTLARNFRSDRNVVAFNLELFQRASKWLDRLGDQATKQALHIPDQAIQDIFDEGYNPDHLADFCKNMKPCGCVDVRLYPFSSKKKSKTIDQTTAIQRSEVMERIVQEMFDKMKYLLALGLQQRDIMILVRTAKEASFIVDALERQRQEDAALQNIALLSADAYRLDASVSVQIIVNALRYLHNPQNTVARAYVLRHYLTDILGRPAEWLDVASRDSEALLPKDFNRSLLALPLYELVERLVQIFLFDTEGRRVLHDDSFLLAFLDKVLAFTGEGHPDLESLLERWDAKLASAAVAMPSDADGIRLMTVHKAKGLESHTLFVPFCNWTIEQDAKGGRGKKNSEYMWCSVSDEPYGHVPLLPVQPNQQLEDGVFRQDYALEHFRRRVDNLNLLYVALTRAQSNLFVSGLFCPDTEGQLDTVADLLHTLYPIPEAQDETAEVLTLCHIGTPEGPKTKSEAYSRMQRRLEAQPLRLKQGSERMNFHESNRSKQFLDPKEETEPRKEDEYIQRGNLYHALLSEIRTPDDAEAALQSYMAQGLLDEAKAHQLRQLLERCWCHPMIKSWFDGSWTLYRECTILRRTPGGHIKEHRPDRVMMRPDETVVVDFKFAAPKPSHKTQIQEYMHLLQSMGSPNVKGYLLYGYRTEVVAVQFDHSTPNA